MNLLLFPVAPSPNLLVNLTLDNSGLTLNGRLGTDDLSLSALAATATFGTANVGAYTINASGYSLSGADAGNYTLTQPTGLSASSTCTTPLAARCGAEAAVIFSIAY